MFFIRPVNQNNISTALSFVEPYEVECVNLSSELLSGGKNCYVLTENSQGSEKTAGVLAFRKKRTVFHCLPFSKYKTSEDKRICSESQAAFLEFFSDKNPFCINGAKAGSLFIKNILKNKKPPLKPSCTNEYFLMEKDKILPDQKTQAAGSHDFSGCRFFSAAAADYQKLLPLELGYQREEVIPKNFDISDQALCAAFKEELLKGGIFALEKNGVSIAKAKISSKGSRYKMLGGVYTLPAQRKKGYAKFLLNEIFNAQKGEANFCLYAKKSNPAAIALYTSLGFKKYGDWLLIYY